MNANTVGDCPRCDTEDELKALEAKCALYAASLRRVDEENDALREQLDCENWATDEACGRCLKCKDATIADLTKKRGEVMALLASTQRERDFEREQLQAERALCDQVRGEARQRGVERDAARAQVEAMRGELGRAIEALEATRWAPCGDLGEWAKTEDGLNHGRVTDALESLRSALSPAPAPDPREDRIAALERIREITDLAGEGSACWIARLAEIANVVSGVIGPAAHPEERRSGGDRG